ncbi:MAG: hypothetical protein PHR25_03985 [Clostridia bacterium]|nr:hypothetical protein [Clostridia bacterium]MDD4375922.1 hypothetical protein [Clostridia bacterium]
MIDIKGIYLTMGAIITMIIFGFFVLNKLINIKSRFTFFLLIVEEIIGAGTIAYMLALTYNAMENYEGFVNKYGDYPKHISIIAYVFVISQIIILILLWIYKLIKRNQKLIKKKKY